MQVRLREKIERKEGNEITDSTEIQLLFYIFFKCKIFGLNGGNNRDLHNNPGEGGGALELEIYEKESKQ